MMRSRVNLSELLVNSCKRSKWSDANDGLALALHRGRGSRGGRDQLVSFYMNPMPRERERREIRPSRKKKRRKKLKVDFTGQSPFVFLPYRSARILPTAKKLDHY